MEVVDTVSQLRQSVRHHRTNAKTIALVPTMGNLHDGHLRLVEQARKLAEYVVVSIFVNPTQFGAGEDFGAYPKTFLEDKLQLENSAADLIFLPQVSEIYSVTANTHITVSGVSNILCGASRPGHFTGVTTIVGKLFNLVQPDVAVFGEKDYQQLCVIRQMVSDLNFPVQIHPVATVRELDGLALSSRNNYLTEMQKTIAPQLYQSLCQARDAIRKGEQNFIAIEQQQIEKLGLAGFEVDYFTIRRQQDLQVAEQANDELVILTAAKLGKTRLIDNIKVKNPQKR